MCVIQSLLCLWFLFSPHLLSPSLLHWVLVPILLPVCSSPLLGRHLKDGFTQVLGTHCLFPLPGACAFRRCWEEGHWVGSRASGPALPSVGPASSEGQQVPLSLSFLICIMRLLWGRRFCGVRDPVCVRDESEGFTYSWMKLLVEARAGGGSQAALTICSMLVAERGHLGSVEVVQLHHHVLLLLTEGPGGDSGATPAVAVVVADTQEAAGPCMVASPLPLPSRGLAAGFKVLPTQAPPWLGRAGGAESGGLALLTQCLGEGRVLESRPG